VPVDPFHRARIVPGGISQTTRVNAREGAPTTNPEQTAPPPVGAAPLGPLTHTGALSSQRGAHGGSHVHARTQQALPQRLRPQRSAGWRTVSAPGAASIGIARVPETSAFDAGDDVTVDIDGKQQRGTFAGFDRKGRALVDVDGARRTVAFSALTRATQTASAYVSALDSVPRGGLVEAKPALARAVKLALATKVTGDHTAQEYIDAFRARGYEAFIVGGAIRDAIRLLHDDPLASDAALVALLHDIDLTTTAPPHVAREICEQLAPELPKGGVWSPESVQQYGVVLAGGPKSVVGGSGLDLATIRVAGTSAPPEKNGDTGETAVPYVFGKDLVKDACARDFTCNALYYDPAHDLVIDPTLQGIADAEHGVLHLAREDIAGEKTISPRFWKFRARGFTSDQETLARIRAHAAQLFDITPATHGTNAGRARYELASALARTGPKDAQVPKHVHAWIDELVALMKRDGCGQQARVIQDGSMARFLVREVLKRTAKKPSAAGGTP
jgi:hypothetical protein